MSNIGDALLRAEELSEYYDSDEFNRAMIEHDYDALNQIVFYTEYKDGKKVIKNVR